jgi:hypothetical protein
MFTWLAKLAIPRWAYMFLGVGLLVGLGLFLHGRAVHNLKQTAFEKGVQHEQDRVIKKLRRIEKAANEVARQAQQLSLTDRRRIATSADTLRVRGPGKAACSSIVPAASSVVRPDRSRDAPVASVPDGQGQSLLGVPFAGAVNFAERCDAYRSEVNSWRDWYKRQAEVWQKSN